MTLLIKREDIKECTGCFTSALAVDFVGSDNSETCGCSHFKSDSGWWLRIDHKRDSVYGDPDEDNIGEVLCPTCLTKHNKAMKEFFDNI